MNSSSPTLEAEQQPHVPDEGTEERLRRISRERARLQQHLAQLAREEERLQHEVARAIETSTANSKSHQHHYSNPDHRSAAAFAAAATAADASAASADDKIGTATDFSALLSSAPIPLPTTTTTTTNNTTNNNNNNNRGGNSNNNNNNSYFANMIAAATAAVSSQPAAAEVEKGHEQQNNNNNNNQDPQNDESSSAFVYNNSNNNEVNVNSGFEGVAHIDEAGAAPTTVPFVPTTPEMVRNNIVGCAQEQVSCRYLQKLFEEDPPGGENRVMILSEIEAQPGAAATLMTDHFGNYLIQAIFMHGSDEEVLQVMNMVKADLVSVALSMHGTRTVQRLIDHLHTPLQMACFREALGPSLTAVIKDLNGTHVVLKALGVLNPPDVDFIYKTLTARCVEIASSRQGCCVLQRGLDVAVGDHRTALVRELINSALQLVQDQFGNYVIQHLLSTRNMDNDKEHLVTRVLRQLLHNIVSLSCNKFSSNVVELCMRHSTDDVRALLIDELTDAQCVPQLVQDGFANYVLQTALTVSSPDQFAQLADALRPHMHLVRNSPYGKKIEAKLSRKPSQQQQQQQGNSGKRPLNQSRSQQQQQQQQQHPRRSHSNNHHHHHQQRQSSEPYRQHQHQQHHGAISVRAVRRNNNNNNIKNQQQEQQMHQQQQHPQYPYPYPTSSSPSDFGYATQHYHQQQQQQQQQQQAMNAAMFAMNMSPFMMMNQAMMAAGNNNNNNMNMNMNNNMTQQSAMPH
eukprot:PhM_4_TR13339/c4_g1_i2/m.17543